MTVLISYASMEGQTEKIARAMARALEALGREVLVMDFHALEHEGLPTQLEGVIIGASVHMEKHPSPLRHWVKTHLDALAAQPAGFFSVSLSAAGPREKTIARAGEYMEIFFKATGWQPTLTASFAGALQYSHYGFFKRWMMKAIIKMAGNPDTDDSRDYEYTDWEAVERFARDFSARIGSSG